MIKKEGCRSSVIDTMTANRCRRRCGACSCVRSRHHQQSGSEAEKSLRACPGQKHVSSQLVRSSQPACQHLTSVATIKNMWPQLHQPLALDSIREGLQRVFTECCHRVQTKPQSGPAHAFASPLIRGGAATCASACHRALLRPAPAPASWSNPGPFVQARHIVHLVHRPNTLPPPSAGHNGSTTQRPGFPTLCIYAPPPRRTMRQWQAPATGDAAFPPCRSASTTQHSAYTHMHVSHTVTPKALTRSAYAPSTQHAARSTAHTMLSQDSARVARALC